MSVSWRASLSCLLLASASASQLHGRADSTSDTQPGPSFPFGKIATTTKSYAQPLSAPLAAETYGPRFEDVSTLLPANVTYTTYSLNRSATMDADGQYGQSAYAALWVNYTFLSTPAFTTTAAATPIPSSELVLPPQLPARALHDTDNLTFPCGFVWGVAGSAWQVEGGLQAEGRGPALLDIEGVNGTGFLGNNDSNVADMHYFLYKQDIARLAALGVPHYSFSIPWTRILPFGVADSPVNQQALDHYDDVINTCLRYGITPVVTLFHFDAPVGIFEDLDSFPRNYAYYAKQVMTRYADRVPYWVTFNEPNVAAEFYLPTWGGLTAFLLAHAEIYHWYKEQLGGLGRLTMKFANNLPVPLDSDNEDDINAAHRYQEFILGIMANPLFLGKQFPQVVLDTPAIDLVPLTDEQIEFMNGTMDYWAFDPYSAQLVASPAQGISSCASNSSDTHWPLCVELGTIQEDGWAIGPLSEGSATIVPAYVRSQFRYVWETYHPKGIMVTEFGFPQIGDAKSAVEAQRYDFERTMYYQNFLTEMLRSIHLDGVNVIGALAWSWIDNNEFGSFGQQYGMIGVNRSDPYVKRYVKRSLFDYVRFFQEHSA